jgi:N-acetylglucosamine-6-phosphate deacetylase
MRSIGLIVVLALIFGARVSAQAGRYGGPPRAAAPAPATPLPLPPVAPEELVIRGGRLIDGVRDEAVPNRGIVIRNGTLLEVNVDLTGRDLSKSRVIVLADSQYVIPGLFDMHAHYEIDLFGQRMDEFHVSPIAYLANGVTSTFVAGDNDIDAMVLTQRRINTGQQTGPRIFNSGPRIGIARQGPDPKTVEEVNQLVDSLTAQGVTSFKVKNISPPMLRALIERAHMHGATVTGHLSSGIDNTTNAKDAIVMGIDRIEHFLGGDALPANKDPYESLTKFDPYSREGQDIIRLYLKHNVVYDPTTGPNGQMTDAERRAQPAAELQTYTPYIQELMRLNPRRGTGTRWDSIRATNLKAVKAFYDAGGTLTTGTDSPGRGNYLAGFMLHREIASFVEAGLPPAAALKAATINSARALNAGDKLGSIEAGKFADLVVVNGNPLRDIRNTRNIDLVVKAGVPFKPLELWKAVEGKLGPAGPEDAAKWGARPTTSDW